MDHNFTLYGIDESVFLAIYENDELCSRYKNYIFGANNVSDINTVDMDTRADVININRYPLFIEILYCFIIGKYRKILEFYNTLDIFNNDSLNMQIPNLKNNLHYIIAVSYKNIDDMHNEYINAEHIIFHYNEAIMSIPHDSKCIARLCAMQNLGCYYSELGNYVQAIEYFTLAITSGNLNCHHHLGYIYEIVYNNIDQAEYHYKISAQYGNSESMHKLAILYYNIRNFQMAKFYCYLAIVNNYRYSECDYISIDNIISITGNTGNTGNTSNTSNTVENNINYNYYHLGINDPIYNQIINHDDLVEITDFLLTNYDPRFLINYYGLSDNQAAYFLNFMFDDSELHDCAICYCQHQIITTNCGHFYCPTCYLKIYATSKKCSVCRQYNVFFV